MENSSQKRSDSAGARQDGFRRLNQSLADYAVLPRSQTALALRPAPRSVPVTAEVLAMLEMMPVTTLVHKRDRAIVVASVLFGTRSDTTASMRLGDVDTEQKSVCVDATEVRVKNSKSQKIAWFPLGSPIEGIVVAWVELMNRLGGRPDDALFPPDAALQATTRLVRDREGPIAPWNTAGGIPRAFKRGCAAAGIPYFNPHSMKHYIKSVRDEFCRTPAQRSAWSYNLGHENERITETHYAKMTDAKRDAIFAAIRQGNTESEEEKDLLLAYHEHQLAPGSHDYERAEALAEARRMRRKQAGKKPSAVTTEGLSISLDFGLAR